MQEMDWSTSAALMGMAGMLGIRAKLFAAQPEQLVYEDFDRLGPLRAHLFLPVLHDNRAQRPTVRHARKVWHGHFPGHCGKRL